MNQFEKKHRIVFKVGTSTLTYENHKPNIRRLRALARVLSDLSNRGLDIALVTSGAIAVGVSKLGLEKRPEDTRSRQAASCIGQCELIYMYDKAFLEYGKNIGQLLMTRSDVENDERRTNLINAFEKMFSYGVIPVINENDGIAVEEIVFGDNDNLSATVAKLINADALVILSDIDGLYTADPRTDEDARLITDVRRVTEEMLDSAGSAGSTRGTGGMVTKLSAVKSAAEAGIDTVLMNGADPDDIYKLFDGHSIGTYFHGDEINA
ncbi:MAG: glutamate 5-kinase [Clostridia bacterium]|nr:glutamate 5-kinase [Clostridia bacterium]